MNRTSLSFRVTNEMTGISIARVLQVSVWWQQTNTTWMNGDDEWTSGTHLNSQHCIRHSCRWAAIRSFIHERNSSIPEKLRNIHGTKGETNASFELANHRRELRFESTTTASNPYDIRTPPFKNLPEFDQESESMKLSSSLFRIAAFSSVYGFQVESARIVYLLSIEF